MHSPASTRTPSNRGHNQPAAPGRRHFALNDARTPCGIALAASGISASQLSGNGPTPEGEASRSESHPIAGFPGGLPLPSQWMPPRQIISTSAPASCRSTADSAGALAAPDHGDTLSAKDAEVVVFARMACKGGGHAVEGRRANC